jgi:peroxiredoxin
MLEHKAAWLSSSADRQASLPVGSHPPDPQQGDTIPTVVLARKTAANDLRILMESSKIAFPLCTYRELEPKMKRRDFLHTAAVGLVLPATVLAQKKPAAAPVAAAPFVLKGTDVAGKAIDLRDYAGKACLVSFFTAECIPCTNDLRLMREFYGANKKRNYVNIGVNMDVSMTTLAEYVDLIKKTIPVDQHFPIAWRNAKGHNDNFGAISSQPTHFVLDKAHKLVLRRNGIFKPSDWDDLWTNLE